MNINTTYTKIITDEDLMETVQHGSNLYPFQFYYEDLLISTVSNGTGIQNWSLFILNPEPLLCGLEKTNLI